MDRCISEAFKKKLQLYCSTRTRQQGHCFTQDNHSDTNVYSDRRRWQSCIMFVLGPGPLWKQWCHMFYCVWRMLQLISFLRHRKPLGTIWSIFSHMKPYLLRKKLYLNVTYTVSLVILGWQWTCERQSIFTEYNDHFKNQKQNMFLNPVLQQYDVKAYWLPVLCRRAVTVKHKKIYTSISQILTLTTCRTQLGPYCKNSHSIDCFNWKPVSFRGCVRVTIEERGLLLLPWASVTRQTAINNLITIHPGHKSQHSSGAGGSVSDKTSSPPAFKASPRMSRRLHQCFSTFSEPLNIFLY